MEEIQASLWHAEFISFGYLQEDELVGYMVVVLLLTFKFFYNSFTNTFLPTWKRVSFSYIPAHSSYCLSFQ